MRRLKPRRLVQEANADLKKIKVLYDENEDKRQELKNALESNNKEEVKKISDNVVQIINEGFDFGKGAVDKIQQAEDMKINDDYKEYLRPKGICVAEADGGVRTVPSGGENATR